MYVVMTKRHFPEVRSMIEFDRLAKNHLKDAYSQLLPTTKRLIRNLSISEHQIIVQQQVQQSVFIEKELSGINSSSSEKSVLRLSTNKVKVPSISDDSPFNEPPCVKQRGTI
jgi:hypothetical protein